MCVRDIQESELFHTKILPARPMGSSVAGNVLGKNSNPHRKIESTVGGGDTLVFARATLHLTGEYTLGDFSWPTVANISKHDERFRRQRTWVITRASDPRDTATNGSKSNLPGLALVVSFILVSHLVTSKQHKMVMLSYMFFFSDEVKDFRSLVVS